MTIFGKNRKQISIPFLDEFNLITSKMTKPLSSLIMQANSGPHVDDNQGLLHHDILTRMDIKGQRRWWVDVIKMWCIDVYGKPRFLMSGTLIFGYKANKNSSTHSKLCTC